MAGRVRQANDVVVREVEPVPGAAVPLRGIWHLRTMAVLVVADERTLFRVEPFTVGQYYLARSDRGDIASAHLCPPVTNAHLVCPLLLVKHIFSFSSSFFSSSF